MRAPPFCLLLSLENGYPKIIQFMHRCLWILDLLRNNHPIINSYMEKSHELCREARDHFPMRNPVNPRHPRFLFSCLFLNDKS
jgi:hypothetical protein